MQIDFSQVSVLIPAYEPTKDAIPLVKQLSEAGFRRIIVVNDGSSEATAAIFQTIKAQANVTLLVHEHNQGKGAAIKTGLKAIEKQADELIGVITVDADGQHLLKDIKAVAQKLMAHPNDLVLGERDFGDDVPWRSKVGNALTRKLFGWMYKQPIKDTQTGLRAIPRKLIRRFLEIPYNGYEYELECLKLVIRDKVKIRSVDIETVYIDNNEASHFNPLVDSIRIYYVFFRYLIIAVVSFLIDLAVFVLVHSLTHVIILSLLCARIVSGSFNFYQNKFNVYKVRDKNKIYKELMSYIGLATAVLFGSYFLIYVFHGLLGWGVITAKVIGDVILFALSFVVQKIWIFKSKAVL